MHQAPTLLVFQQLHLLLLLLLTFSTTLPLTNASSGEETLIGIVGRDFVVLGADSSLAESILWRASNLDKIAVLPNCQPSPIAVAVMGHPTISDRLVGQLAADCAIREWEQSHGSDVEYLEKSDGDEWTLKQSSSSSAALTISAVAHYARSIVASNRPAGVSLLVAGMSSDKDEEEEDDYLSKFAQRLQRQVLEASSKEERQPVQEVVETAESSNSNNTKKSRPQLFWIDSFGALQKLQYGAHGTGANFCLSILDRGYKPEMTKEEAIKLMLSCFDQLRVRYVYSSPQPPCVRCFDGQEWTLIR